MEQNILKSVKTALNVGEDDTSFDGQLIPYINTAFSNLTDMGVGPQGGFVVDDGTETWDSYFPDEDDPAKLKVQLSKVKTVVSLRTRLLFDSPTSGFLMDAVKAQLAEAEWRLNVNREETDWVDPTPVDDDELMVVDGGDPTEGF